MTPKQKFITQAGLDKLKEELEYLKHTKRREVAQRIRDAQELGDLSENAEYTAAKEEQANTDRRIMELEDIIRSVTVIKKASRVEDVHIGTTVEVENTEGQKFSYTITGSNEADPSAGMISNESPLGQKFLGKKVGEQVEVTTPKNVLTFKILNIS
ncbi:MAG: transcription elongation factor GreA [Candidatus Kerfeldbacteria bacterium RIFCSPHIGHO2_12_FULL_48_17]|uniref:Transcription elongation factor GreA n=1 Tax=Candidatus Kerfeldbacteria bacterium RIFCSPHIGHO2_12_FULL_48_17 TaxID=1798542 RepID=A0A1G2AXV7_9BACT|nr:MAG: transcription elongation factor GreA [Candidatus Kerfeldbacteria bacterium RIFCSPHIGHO2_12_FULL_48_17]